MEKNNSKSHNQNKATVKKKTNKITTKPKAKQPTKKSSSTKTTKKKVNTNVKAKQQVNNTKKVDKKAIFDYEKEIEKTTVLNMPKEESSSKIEDTFKVEKEEAKKIETPKKKVNIEKMKENLNKTVFNSRKKEKKEETEEEKKKKRRFLIILLLLLIFFFFILDVDDLVIGTPLRPKLSKVDENWYKEKVVEIEEDAYTRKNLSHYLYCIRQDEEINKCEWKKTTTKNVIVSTNGINYVWFKGVTEDGLVGKASKPIVVKIDNEGIKDIEISTKVTENSIKVTVKAEDEESGIDKFYYKVNDGEYIESKDEKFKIKDLKPGTEYEITVKVVDKLGNEKEVTFKVTTKGQTKDTTTDNENTNKSEQNNNDSNDNNNDNNNGNDNTTNNNDNTTNESTEVEEIPEISLSGVPTSFKRGESYKLPTSYKFGKSGGTVKCTVNDKEYKDTKDLSLGIQTIKCSATSNTGTTVKVEKEVEVIPENSEEAIWDGWIRMNLSYPANSTNWEWRIGKEDEVRTGEENTGWQEYTGPITVRLTDVENVYIRYVLNGEEVIVSPNGKLVVDIEPESYSIKDKETTTVKINYSSEADKKQYRINGGEWQNYTESFTVPNDTQVEARIVKTTIIYDEDGNIESKKKTTNYDSVYISTISENAGGTTGGTGSSGSTGGTSGGNTGSSSGTITYGTNYTTTPSYAIAGPIISISPETVTEEVTVTLTTKKVAREIYYKIGESGKYQKYDEAFTVDKNTTVYAYYIEDTNGQTSKTSSKYISNIKEGDKPLLAINLSTTAKNQESVDVSLTASDYTSLEYSLDGEIYVPYTETITVIKNCTVYAKASNENGITYTSRTITNIGSATSPKESLTVGIFTTPDESEVTGLLNKVTVEIQYDIKAEKKYYKIGNGAYQEYTGPFEVEENTSITGYATSENGSGKATKKIDFLTTGISEPIISISTTSPTTSVKVTIDYDKNASVTKYRVGSGDLMEYTGAFEVDENEVIYAYSKNELNYESESYYEITNIVALPRYTVLDMGSYFILKLNYPTTSEESTREYKWTPTGEWKQYDSQGILLIKSEYEDELIGDDTSGIKVKDSNGKEIIFTDHYYVVNTLSNDLMENLFMRWDYGIPTAPTIKLNSTAPERVVYATITYDNYSVTKEYKIVSPSGEETEWLPYEGKIKIKENNTIIYARGISSLGEEGEIGSKKITNIDEEDPDITVKADFETPVRKLTIQLIGTDDQKVQCVGWGKGEKDLEYFEDVAGLLNNYSTFKVEENGIYTIYVEDKVGKTTIKQIEVTNIDKTAPDIDINVLTEEYGTEAEVEIDYGDSTTKQYKIGVNGTYKTYTDKLTIKSNDVLNYVNEDGTLTIYAKGTDSAGNVVEVSEIIYVLDLDAPTTPIINASTGYPLLTEYGVKYDDALSVVYDTRDDIINYISMDGENWEEYTGTEHVTSGTIYAKSVKKISGLTISVSKKVTQPSDALGIEVYDGDTSTSISGTDSYKYMYIDESAIGQTLVDVVYKGFSGDPARITYFDKDGNIISYKDQSSNGVTSNSSIIPEGTVKLAFNGTGRLLYEIYIDTTPKFDVEKKYPLITSAGIEKGYNLIDLNYYKTAVKKVYKIDDGSWTTYKNDLIRLEIGEVLYAKSIDKNSDESTVLTYTAVLPSDAITEQAYDNNTSTYMTGVANYRYMDVDSSVIGETLIHTVYKGYSGDPARITYFNSAGTVIGYKDQSANGVTSNSSVIPDGTVKLAFNGTGRLLYEIKIDTTPKFVVEKKYPLLTITGIKKGYNLIDLNYYKTAVKKVYKINDGSWTTYKNDLIRLEIGEVLYAKSIDRNGDESTVLTYTAVLPSDAITEQAYDNNTSTYMTGVANYRYMDVDPSVIGKTLIHTVYKGSGGDPARITYFNSAGTIIGYKDQSANKVTSNSSIIPDGTVKLAFNGTGRLLYEIKLSNFIPSTDETETPEITEPEEEIVIPNFISSPTITVSDSDTYTATKTVNISYPSGGYTNEYSYDAENWTTYTGSITIDKETTIFARSISDGEVISSSSYQITKIDNIEPSISLSEIPLEINVGEEYTLPSSYSFNGNKTGGTVVCLLDDATEVTTTKDITSGIHNIKCTATTGSGLIKTAEINITVIDNTTSEEEKDTEEKTEEDATTDSGTTEETPTTENQEGVEENEEKETTEENQTSTE